MNGRVLITGAGGALGRSVVARFLDEGDRVLTVDHNEEHLAELTPAPSDALSVRKGPPTGFPWRRPGSPAIIPRLGQWGSVALGALRARRSV